ncbi:MAG TPA: HAMP domain-containing sensor histidine kinase [Anaeromyxobacteraceae bacterium]|nr:HAMP domain-containing sensor histidine kinase [Anaeromyxobacteraceae bacterium]
MSWRPRQPRLFWRLYLAGLTLLALVAIVNGIVGSLVGRANPARSAERLARFAAEHVSEHRGDVARIEHELRQMADAFKVDMAVRLDDGTVVASAGEPMRLPEAERAQLDSGVRYLEDGDRPVYATRLPGAPPSYVIVEAPARPFPVERAAAFISAWLFVLALAAFPLARALSRPMERLTEVARKLGAGDLSARAGLRRTDEVGELSLAFDDMASRLEGLVRSERQLLADVSHELRTPLSRIRVALDLATEGDVARARRYLEEIRIDLEELDQLLGDVLTTARLDQAGGRGEVPLRLQQVRARDVLDQAVERFRRAHPARTLEVRVGEGLPGLVADPAMLRRVVDNLLDNAAKYSEAPSAIELSARRDGDAVEVAVKDEGIGVDPADLPRLFTPFFRTDRSRARGTGGVGLGLALAKRIVDAHGGSIAVDSRAGLGTTVRFRLPAEA